MLIYLAACCCNNCCLLNSRVHRQALLRDFTVGVDLIAFLHCSTHFNQNIIILIIAKANIAEDSRHLLHVAHCQMLAPPAGEAEHVQATAKVPQAQSRPGVAVKPESLAGCG